MILDCISFDDFAKTVLSGVKVYDSNLLIADSLDQLPLLFTPLRIDAIIVVTCLEGEIECRINMKDYSLRQNSILVNIAGNLIQINKTHSARCHVMMVSSRYLDNLKIDFDDRAAFFIDSHCNAAADAPQNGISSLCQYTSLLCTEITNRLPSSPKVIDGLMTAFSHTVIYLIRNYRSVHEKIDVNGNGRIMFQRFMELLETYHTRERSVAFYASKLSVTPKYMGTVIKNYSGKSAIEWINEHIILEAKLMLMNTHSTIQEIAYNLNFSSQSLFGKYFKTHTGLSPKEFRSLQ